MAKSGKVKGVGPWARVGAEVGQRRVRLRMSQEKAAAIAGISRETWGQIESGVQENYRPATLMGVCAALEWAPESIMLLLDGRDPIDLAPTADDLGPRVAAIESAVERLEAELAAIRAAIEGPGPPRQGGSPPPRGGQRG